MSHAPPPEARGAGAPMHDTHERSPSSPILSLHCVTAGRTPPVLREVTWTLREAELWAVVGPNGAGKSSLPRVLRGQLPITGGALRYGSGARGRALAADPFGQILSVSFVAQTGLLKGAAGYTQSRWHAGHDDGVARGGDVLGSSLAEAGCRRIVDALDLGDVLDRRVTELSNGQRRKLLLARAAARRPTILALDNPFNGLDRVARATVSQAAERLHREGIAILVLTSREDEIPDAATDVLLLDAGRVVASGPREAVLADERFGRLMRPPPGSGPAAPASRAAASGSAHAEPPTARSSGAHAEPLAVVELRDVDLTYGAARVLRGLSWTVRCGERWAVLGPNGAGKSALLSLILADNPQAYANDVSLFGRRRGSGDTIWDIRRRIGSVSPEMHLYEEADPRVLDVIAHGLRDPGRGRGPLEAHEVAAAEAWVTALDLEHCRDRRLGELSEGERQMALLGRALGRRPELLVLDEPCQGLDAHSRSRFLHVLDRELHATGTTLIYVTHDLDEIPAAVTHGLLMREGRSALQGSAEEVLAAYRESGDVLAGHHHG